MSKRTIVFFGQGDVEGLSCLNTHKALLLMLALAKGTPVDRQDLTDTVAGHNNDYMRRLLSDLRKGRVYRRKGVMEEGNGLGDVLMPAVVDYSRPSHHWLLIDRLDIDVLEFDRLRLSDNVQDKTTAIGLYRGKLLESCEIPFVRDQRNAYHQRFLEVMEAVATHQFTDNAGEAAELICRGINLFPDEPQLHVLLGRLLETNGYRSCAWAVAQKYLASCPRDQQPAELISLRIRIEDSDTKPDHALEGSPLFEGLFGATVTQRVPRKEEEQPVRRRTDIDLQTEAFKAILTLREYTDEMYRTARQRVFPPEDPDDTDSSASGASKETSDMDTITFLRTLAEASRTGLIPEDYPFTGEQTMQILQVIEEKMIRLQAEMDRMRKDGKELTARLLSILTNIQNDLTTEATFLEIVLIHRLAPKRFDVMARSIMDEIDVALGGYMSPEQATIVLHNYVEVLQHIRSNQVLHKEAERLVQAHVSANNANLPSIALLPNAYEELEMSSSRIKLMSEVGLRDVAKSITSYKPAHPEWRLLREHAHHRVQQRDAGQPARSSVQMEAFKASLSFREAADQALQFAQHLVRYGASEESRDEDATSSTEDGDYVLEEGFSITGFLLALKQGATTGWFPADFTYTPEEAMQILKAIEIKVQRANEIIEAARKDPKELIARTLNALALIQKDFPLEAAFLDVVLTHDLAPQAFDKMVRDIMDEIDDVLSDMAGPHQAIEVLGNYLMVLKELHGNEVIRLGAVRLVHNQTFSGKDSVKLHPDVYEELSSLGKRIRLTTTADLRRKADSLGYKKTRELPKWRIG